MPVAVLEGIGVLAVTPPAVAGLLGAQAAETTSTAMAMLNQTHNAMIDIGDLKRDRSTRHLQTKGAVFTGVTAYSAGVLTRDVLQLSLAASEGLCDQAGRGGLDFRSSRAILGVVRVSPPSTVVAPG